MARPSPVVPPAMAQRAELPAWEPASTLRGGQVLGRWVPCPLTQSHGRPLDPQPRHQSRVVIIPQSHTCVDGEWRRGVCRGNRPFAGTTAWSSRSTPVAVPCATIRELPSAGPNPSRAHQLPEQASMKSDSEITAMGWASSCTPSSAWCRACAPRAVPGSSLGRLVTQDCPEGPRGGADSPSFAVTVSSTTHPVSLVIMLSQAGRRLGKSLLRLSPESSVSGDAVVLMVSSCS